MGPFSLVVSNSSSTFTLNIGFLSVYERLGSVSGINPLIAANFDNYKSICLQFHLHELQTGPYTHIVHRDVQ